MKLSRRRLFELGLGAGQVALLSRFGILEARAAPPEDAPTKLLTIWLDGGIHWETFFAPLSAAGITKYIPGPSGGLRPFGYTPAQVGNFDGTPVDLAAPGPRKLRGPILWNWASPGDTRGVVPGSNGEQEFRPYGYAWADPTYKLYNRTALLVGADQGTASHQSGIVAGLCGVAGSNFRAPSVQAVIAAAMAKRFPDRALANVLISGPSPSAPGLPAVASPTLVTSDRSVEPTLSDRRDGAWQGLRTRRAVPNVGFDGSPKPGVSALTATDELVLSAARAHRGQSSAGTDSLLEALHDTYRGASNVIAKDILTTLSKVKGYEYLSVADPRYPSSWDACIGSADSCGSGSSISSFDFALKLLKSDLVTSVSVRATSFNNFSFDTHFSGGAQLGGNHLRIALEGIGRALLEMSLTPSSRPGRTLLDDTLVYVFSDFGRTFPKNGSDHHPATCAIVAGGLVNGNQMFGGYDESNPGSPMGSPTALVEEDGSVATRSPNSQDVVATVLHAFGLKGGSDFFIPGGYGHFNGVSL